MESFEVQNIKGTLTLIPWWQEKEKQSQKAFGVQQVIGLLVHLMVSPPYQVNWESSIPSQCANAAALSIFPPADAQWCH